MSAFAAARRVVTTSCGTLVINKRNQILLCHVTGADHWDIPKGMMDDDETPMVAAKRELFEETGLVFEDARFEEIGDFDYLSHKRLHLYKIHAPESPDSVAHLICTSHFAHHITGKPTPEMDGFRWASRDEIRQLCTPRMANRLLALNW